MPKFNVPSNCLLAAITLLAFTCTASSQQTFTSYDDYCKGMVQASAPALTAMIMGLSKEEAVDEMSTLTDPAAIKMSEELVTFYYEHKKPVDPSKLRSELLAQCLAKQIFTQ